MKALENQRTSINWNRYLAVAYAEGFCEGDDASYEEQLEAWAFIAKNNIHIGLQGWFGRMVDSYTNRGIITEDGEINWDEVDNLMSIRAEE